MSALGTKSNNLVSILPKNSFIDLNFQYIYSVIDHHLKK